MTRWVYVLLVAGCSSSSRPPPPVPDDAPVARPLPPDPPPLPVGDLPTECGVYKALAGKLARCDRLGPQRGLLERQFDTSWKALQSIPVDERNGIGAACKAAADGLRVALAPCGG